MFDLNTLLFGALLGLALGGAIILFLIYAAVNAAKDNVERARFNGLSGWSRREPQYNHLHLMGRDLDSFDW